MMIGRRNAIQEDVRFRVLRLLRENPEVSQRDLLERLVLALVRQIIV